LSYRLDSEEALSALKPIIAHEKTLSFSDKKKIIFNNVEIEEKDPDF